MSMTAQIYAISPERQGDILVDPDAKLDALFYDEEVDEDSVVDLQKSWDGLHYLLTGTPHESGLPLGFLISGGRSIGGMRSYGPARMLNVTETNAIHQALLKFSDEVLWERFNPKVMLDEGVYPSIWREPEADLRSEYTGYFHELTQLTARASGAGMGLVIVLS